MAGKEELQNQLDVINSLNSAIEQGNKLMAARGRLIASQTDLSRELANAINDGTAEANDRINNLDAALRRVQGTMGQANDKSTSLGQALKDAADSAKEARSGFDGFNVAGTSAVGSLFGLRAGLTITIGQFQLMGGVIGGATQGLLGIGQAIIALPFRLLGNLVNFATSGGGGMELREAYERVRETFGDLATNEAKDLIDSFSGLRSESGNLAGSGLSLGRIFGHGQGGLAAAMDALRDIAEAMGARFSVLSDQFARAGAEIIIFQRGLGLSEESMAAFATRAISSGRDMTDVLGETANLAVQLGDRFGINSKLISRDIGTMMEDFENFGNLSQRELATTAVYARQLGLEVEDLQGVIGAFDDFESAAENASRLAQAFGMNIDALDMLNAQNPVERIDELRQAFFAAGRSVEDLTRQERALLAQTTDLSGATLEAAFARQNMGMSYDQISAAASDAAEAPISTEEAMLRLADSIERVFESGGQMDSFFQAFAEGFEQGLRWFGPTRELFHNIRRSLIVTRQAGRQFARDFVQFFPGIEEIVTALRDLFEPERFRDFFSRINVAFRDFFQNLNPNNPGSTVGSFLDALRNAFTGAFGADGDSILMRLRDGFQQIMNFIGQTIVGSIPHIANAITTVIQSITALLRGEELPLMDAAGEALGGLGGAFAEAFQGLGPALMDAFEQIGPALKEALGAFFQEVIMDLAPYLIAGFGALVASNAVIGGIVGAGKAAVMTIFANVGGTMVGLFGSGGPAGGTGVTQAAQGTSSIINTLGSMNSTMINRAAGALLALGVSFTAALIVFIGGMSFAYGIAERTGMLDDPQKFIMFASMVAIGIAGTVAIVTASNALTSLAGAIPSAIIGIVAAAGLFTGGVLLFMGGLNMIQRQAEAYGLDERRLAMTLGVVAAAFTLSLPMIAAGAVLGAMILNPLSAALIGGSFTAGISAAAASILVAVQEFVPVLQEMDRAMSSVNTSSVRVAVETFANLIGALSPLTDVVSNITSLENATPRDMQNIIETTREFISGVLQQISTTVTGILDVLRGPGLSEEEMRTASAISSVITAFADLLGNFAGPSRRIEREIRRGLFSRSESITTEEYATIQDRIDGVTGLLETMSGGSLQRLGSVIEQVGQLNITEEGLRKVEAVTGFLGTVSNLINTFTMETEEGTSVMSSRDLGNVFGRLRQTAEAMAVRAPGLMDSFDAIADAVTDYTTDQIETTIGAFRSIVEGYNDIVDILQDFGEIDINEEIDTFAGNIGVRNASVTVRRDPVNVTINLNVRMDADQIANVLTGDRNSTFTVRTNPLTRANDSRAR